MVYLPTFNSKLHFIAKSNHNCALATKQLYWVNIENQIQFFALSGHCASPNCVAGNPMSSSNQYVQLNNVRLSTDSDTLIFWANTNHYSSLQPQIENKMFENSKLLTQKRILYYMICQSLFHMLILWWVLSTIQFWNNIIWKVLQISK